MNESTTGYKVTIGLLVAALLVVGAIAMTRKSGPDPEVTQALTKVQSSLDDCKSQRGDLKDKVARLETDLKRAQEQGAVPACVPGSAISAGHASAGDGKIALSPEQIKKVVTSQTGGLKACYTSALKRDNNLQVQPINVTFKFSIHPGGNVGGTALSADTHIDQQLVECFKQAVGRWRFPAFAGEPIPVETPQTFQPESRR
jgi:hypothetical protein